MSQRPSLLQRLWCKLKGRPAKAVSPVKLNAAAPLPPRKEVRSSVEPLEGRIAPATLLPGGKGISYFDIDGDRVTVEFSKPLFNLPAATLDTVLQGIFTFSAGKAHSDAATPANDGEQQLQTIDLSAFPAAQGVSLSITAVKFDFNNDTVLDGDGMVNVGAIKASTTTGTGVDLGSVSIQGDLGQIDVGRAHSTMALRSLTVDTLGKFTTTQAGTPTYESLITGALGSFHAREVDGGYLHVQDATDLFNGKLFGRGSIGSVTIDSKLSVRAAGVSNTNDGVIQTAGAIGTLRIGSGADGDGIIGGAGDSSGIVNAAGGIGTVVINGSIAGGDGDSSGGIFAQGRIAVAQVLHDITGGSGLNSGVLSTAKDFVRVEVHGALLGGLGDSSGTIQSGTNIASLTMGLRGAAVGTEAILSGGGDDSGVVSAAGSITSATIYGDVVGLESGSGAHAGGISAGGLLRGLTLEGSLIGGDGDHLTGFVTGGTLGTVKIMGNIEGGTGATSGVLISAGAAANILVTGHLAGGTGQFSGGISTGQSGAGQLALLNVQGGIQGGHGDSSGLVSAYSIGILRVEVASGAMSTAALQGDLGVFSGSVHAASSIDQAILSGDLAGSTGDDSGSISAGGTVKAITAGKLIGSEGDRSGSIWTHDNFAGARPVAGVLGTLTLGSVTGGSGLNSGAVIADGSIVHLTAGDVVVGAGSGSGLIQAGMGPLGSGNIAFLQVGSLGSSAAASGGSVQVNGTLAQFKAAQLFDATVHAIHLGTVTVSGDVTGSLITAQGGAAAAAKTDVALARLTVSGDVTTSRILVGYDLETQPVNGHAQIGAVSVLGDWNSSSVAAGVRDSLGDGFADSDDAAIPVDAGTGSVISKISSIVIKGTVSGTSANSSHYGFVARQIGTVSVHGAPVTLTGGVAELVPLTTNNVSVRALG